jgi:DNA-binding response OmpR family regulator
MARALVVEDGYTEGMRTIDVHIRRLRDKLPSGAVRIVSVKPIGCRLADPGESE